MKNVRVFFSKKGKLRFVSHLDMNRFFTRVLRKSGLPIWYTEGYNPHPYLTFALPLSLGFESDYEILDFRLIEDDFPLEKVKEKLEAVLPEYVIINSVQEPIMKAGKITAAAFDITFETEEVATAFENFLKGSVVISKKTKKGEIKVIEVSNKIISCKRNETVVSVVLPAGNDNLNPSLLVDSYNAANNLQCYATYNRTAVYGTENNLFV